MPGTPLLLCLWLCNDYIQLIMRYFNGKVDCLYFMLSWDFLKELIDLPILIRLGTCQVAQCLLIWWSLSVILLKLRYLAMLSAVYRKLFISFFVISVMYVESFFFRKLWKLDHFGIMGTSLPLKDLDFRSAGGIEREFKNGHYILDSWVQFCLVGSFIHLFFLAHGKSTSLLAFQQYQT